MEEYKTCSISLQLNEIGLLLLGEDLSPFLKIGTTLAESQSSSTQFVVRDCVKITCNIGVISDAHAFRIAIGIPSGPGDLLASKFCNN